MKVAPLPVTAVVGLHYGVAGLFEMSIGVPAWRRVTTADVAACQAAPKRNPAPAGFFAFLATPCAALNSGIGVFHVFTLRHFLSPSGEVFWMCGRSEGIRPDRVRFATAKAGRSRQSTALRMTN